MTSPTHVFCARCGHFRYQHAFSPRTGDSIGCQASLCHSGLVNSLCPAFISSEPKEGT